MILPEVERFLQSILTRMKFIRLRMSFGPVAKLYISQSYTKAKKQFAGDQFETYSMTETL
jgi:hypothetical protein